MITRILRLQDPRFSLTRLLCHNYFFMEKGPSP